VGAAAYGRSTVKNTIAALVLVLDEAVRDGLLLRNPAKDRARRRTVGAPPLPMPAAQRVLGIPHCRMYGRSVGLLMVPWNAVRIRPGVTA
jgi:hypothetical protein